MNFNHKEAMRYLRADPEDKTISILVDTVYLKMRNEVQARNVVQKYKCKVDGEGVTLDCGVHFTSTNLDLILSTCNFSCCNSICFICILKKSLIMSN